MERRLTLEWEACPSLRGMRNVWSAHIRQTIVYPDRRSRSLNLEWSWVFKPETLASKEATRHHGVTMVSTLRHKIRRDGVNIKIPKVCTIGQTSRAFVLFLSGRFENYITAFRPLLTSYCERRQIYSFPTCDTNSLQNEGISRLKCSTPPDRY